MVLRKRQAWREPEACGNHGRNEKVPESHLPVSGKDGYDAVDKLVGECERRRESGVASHADDEA